MGNPAKREGVINCGSGRGRGIFHAYFLLFLFPFSLAQAVEFSDSTPVRLNLDINSLTVSSAFEEPTPGGTTYYISGSSVKAEVVKNIFDELGSRWMCSGWIGSGSIPAEGTKNKLTFTITGGTRLIWQWRLLPPWEQVSYYLIGELNLSEGEKKALDDNRDKKIDVADAVSLVPTPTPTPTFLDLEFETIPAGSFEMGAVNDDPGWTFPNSEPVHTVTIGYDFQLSRYEITQSQWEEVMGYNPASVSTGKGPHYPVYNVSWNECQEFIARINAMGRGTYRLPSEAEWEYACRGPVENPHRYGRFSFGDSDCDATGDASCELDEYAWWRGNNKPNGAKKIGRKKPNPWGLYDMHGNVMEWCRDRFHLNYDGAPSDGSAWESGTEKNRVFRGGGWNHNANTCQSSFRNSLHQSEKSPYLGFRIVKEMW